MFLDSSMVEHSAVNRRVVGSSPTRGVEKICEQVCRSFFHTDIQTVQEPEKWLRYHPMGPAANCFQYAEKEWVFIIDRY